MTPRPTSGVRGRLKGRTVFEAGHHVLLRVALRPQLLRYGQRSEAGGRAKGDRTPNAFLPHDLPGGSLRGLAGCCEPAASGSRVARGPDASGLLSARSCWRVRPSLRSFLLLTFEYSRENHCLEEESRKGKNSDCPNPTTALPALGRLVTGTAPKFVSLAIPVRDDDGLQMLGTTERAAFLAPGGSRRRTSVALRSQLLHGHGSLRGSQGL
jgi:hypothetical protein